MADNDVQQPLTVLLIEDSVIQAKIVRNVLATIDNLQLLDVAEDGVEGMAFLRREGEHANAELPNLVLLDINMPRMDGFEVLREMKADPVLCRIPVIMLTTSTDEHDIAKSYQDGASTYIAKPVDLNNLKHVFDTFGKYWKAAKLPKLE